MPDQTVSQMTQVNYAPRLVLPAIDMTQPPGSKNVAVSAGELVAAAGNPGSLFAIAMNSVALGQSAAGSGPTDAASLPAQFNEVTTVAAGEGVRLIDPGSEQAFEVIIVNASATQLLLYPPAGAAIGSAAVNAAVPVAAGATIRVSRFSATKWYQG